MYCKNCGNKLKEDEKFCGKCGKKVKQNQINNENKIIKIKLSTILLIILVVFLLFIGLIIFLINIGEFVDAEVAKEATEKAKQIEEEAIEKAKAEQTIENTNSTIQNNSNNSSMETTNGKDILSVIDQDKKEFKINAKELAETIIEVNDDRDELERSIMKTPLTYEIQKQTEESTGKDVNCYILSYKNLGTVPFMLIANADTNNVYRISVSHPFLNDYGKEFNTSAIEKNYTLLYTALTKLNQKELWTTIGDIYKEISNSPNGLPSDWNLKGVYPSLISGGTNSYGNISGLYYMYCTR